MNPDPLKDFIRQRLTEKARREGFEPTPQELDEATEHFARQQGSEYRQQYFQMKAREGQEEARFAQPSGGALDALERVGRSTAGRMALGVTSPLRAVSGEWGDKLTETYRNFLPEQSMGGRGSSALGDVAEEFMGGLGEMGASAIPGLGGYSMASKVMKGASKIPGVASMVGGLAPRAETGSAAIQALKAAGRALPGEMVRGAASGVAAMPYETLREGDPMTNIGTMAAFGATGIGRRVSASIPEEHMLNKVVHEFKPSQAPANLIDPEKVLAERAARRAGVPAQEAPMVDPAITQIQAEAAKPISVEGGSDVADGTPGATKKPYTGGDPLDWVGLDPTQNQQAHAAWETIKGNPQKIAEYLGIDPEKYLGAGGKSPHTPTVENIANAKTPQELHGWLQKALVRKASGAAPKFTNKAKPRTAKLTPVATEAAPAAPESGPSIEMTPRDEFIKQEAAASVNQFNQATKPEVPFTTAPDLSGTQTVTGVTRPVKAKRADALADAPRMADGTLDWDKLTPAHREVVKRSLGKGYREKVTNMTLANIQKVLSNGEFSVFMKALQKAPKAAAAAEAPAAPRGEDLPITELPLGGVKPRKGKSAIIPEATTPVVTPEVLDPSRAAALAAGQPYDMGPGNAERLRARHAELKAQQAPEAAATPAVDKAKVTPGWWDSAHATPARKAALAKAAADRRQMPGDPQLWASTPFEQLPPFLRKDLAQMDAPAVKPEGGAPAKGANFPARRKQGPKQSPPRQNP